MQIPTVKTLRTQLGRSQKQMADLLGISKKAVQSYEQGWRTAPPHVEQMVLLQAILARHADLQKMRHCWQVNKCSPQTRRSCPSAKLRTPGLCWMLTGTLCQGQPMGNWAAKRDHCFQCEVMKSLLEPDA
jgi:DNA-binding XRE family transcriptional regulator